MKFNVYWIGMLLFVNVAYSQPSNDLATIERELLDSETGFTDIIAGAEKHIRWFSTPQQKTDISLVYLHGFSASRQELSPMVARLADKLGANVFYTRLTGHGRSDDAMAEGSVDTWKQDTLEAHRIGRLIGNKVVVIGTSTGATLAIWLNAQKNIKAPYASILISPNFGVNSSSAKIVQSSLGLWFAKLVTGDYRSFTPQNEFHARYWTERYPLEAVVPMLDLVDEVDQLDKSIIQTPQLFVYSPADKVVNVEKIIATSQQMTGSKTVLAPFTLSNDPVQHVLVGKASGSIEQIDPMLKLIISFLNEL